MVPYIDNIHTMCIAHVLTQQNVYMYAHRPGAGELLGGVDEEPLGGWLARRRGSKSDRTPTEPKVAVATVPSRPELPYVASITTPNPA